MKSRSDSTSGPQGDSIYTTPAGFHHQQQQQQQQKQQQQQLSQEQQQPITHHQHHLHLGQQHNSVNHQHQQQQPQHPQLQQYQLNTSATNNAAGASPEAMKVRMAAMILQPPTRV